MPQNVTAKFVEFGIGNGSFISTEWEYTDGSEQRFSGFRRLKVNEVYLRVWIGYKVYILSSKEGFKVKQKNKSSFKFLLGVGGK